MELPTYTKTWHNDVYAQIDASRPELSFQGKRVVITGGGGGIGAATAEAFAVAGAGEVIILGRTDKSLHATKKKIEAKHSNTKVTAIVADISNPASTTQAFDAISTGGPIDVYINNAGYLSDIGPTVSANPEEWWRSFEVNIKGSLYAVQAALKDIAPDGVIINVSTGGSHIPNMPGHSAYAVSKLGSSKLFEYIQHENPGLRVFNLQPGIIEGTGIATKASVQSGLSWPQQDTRK
jgi:NAD(P)-dependent dehydrogenase (short-subunit alcohol dehydrogenase family)